MIAGSKAIEEWMLHITGERKLDPGDRCLLTEAVDLNQNAQKIISTYGQKEFDATIGFLDMRGFSSKSWGKTPSEILGIVKPFIDSIIEVAGKQHWIIDKTIGDEVMLVCPDIGTDAGLALPELFTRNHSFLEVFNLIADLLVEFRQRSIEDRLTSGFAMGRLCLDKVGTAPYSEWTCYGNAVNTAKRLQSVAAQSNGASSHCLALGASLGDYPEIDKWLDVWEQIFIEVGRVTMVAPARKSESFKGVGMTSYVVSPISLKDGF
jgi:class 3 adenylate cyclase